MASVQWDRWQFMLSAPRLVKQDVTVISHSHRDHWARNLAEKDVILVPQEVSVPTEHRSLTTIVAVSYAERIGKMRFIKLDRRRLHLYLDQTVDTPHAFWWLVSSKHHDNVCRVIWVADANVRDAVLLRATVAEMFRRGTPIHGAILPSFGGVSAHGTMASTELATAIEGLAHDLRDIHGATIGGLPHPVDATWADYNAVRLPSIDD